MSTLYGAVEAGGTKFICAVGEDPSAPRDIRRISTSPNPVETLAEVTAYFRTHAVAAIGISSFGPIDYRRGCIANTPKPGWKDFPIKSALERAFDVPVAFETDVNGAALGEARFGAGRGSANFAYFTVGTGIGGGAIASGLPVRGLLHPEMGHIFVRRHLEDPAEFAGVCPFHHDCLEGMASGPAMQARWGRPGHELPHGHVAWQIEADYLAQACATVTYVLSPESIVLGGGVMAQQHLFPLIRARLVQLLNGYLEAPAILPPALPLPAVTGALAMAADLLQSR